AGSDVLADSPWIGRRIDSLARAQYVTPVQLQEMLDGPRGDLLPPHVRNAEALIAAMRKLAALDAGRPQFLLHGDSHAGNAYRTAQGPGLIDWQLLQRGGWALDAAYHICAVLPVDLAEREERNLLGHYLETMRGHGLTMPDDEAAWLLYRQAAVYGYYLWAITRRVDPAIINVFVPRLGLAVARHDSFALLDAA
ncbi:MAG: phosphotransferase, partial [Sphingobium sp.]